ncbi:MAG: imidazole glycerol phosphate synthase subunit HisH [Planctomycetia bacterium]|nr:imidazole glycerol phosphate synthase subunit HisH [Planctomycetia bacterium]
MILIVDYGMGNLRSVQKGFEKVGFEAKISSDPAEIRRATKVVLPGVGAFPDAMTELHTRRLIDPIREAIDAEKPFLGVCLGLQLLFETGTEGCEDINVGEQARRHEGLGILPGEVVRFDLPREFKVPHMGWNKLDVRRESPLTVGLSAEPYFYFVHSYFVVPGDPEVVAGETNYHRPFTSLVRRGNLYASQFHPEKSQRDGLTVLKNFAEL